MDLRGRQCAMLPEEVPSNCQSRPAMDQGLCSRCGSVMAVVEQRLPTGVYYCKQCLNFGRLTSAQVLVSKVDLVKEARQIELQWAGQLTPAQQTISEQLVLNYQQQQHSLVWAVTGSGKTEMIFHVIAQVLKEGGRVCVASPRIDVCRELYPRIDAVFPQERCLLLYGDSEETYRYSYLTICTTHQLMHFYRAFDLLIVDEIDAFPYEGNPQLRFAVKQALKATGSYVYLTATPPQHLLEEIKSDFHIAKLPIRYHQRPLIVPELIFYEHWQTCYHQKWWMRKLIRYVTELIKHNAVLIFCPSIAYMQRLTKKLKPYFQQQAMTDVSAQDEQRETKVQQMREKVYQIFLTTTILERGVTFEKVSVIVMGANHPVFSKSALVQIAGRVDRKGAYNHGRVIFFFNQNTLAIRQAIAEINQMNTLAQRWRTNEV
jgi:Superfamily II DNA/RNA helicase required for DNA uptake (late competence protein)